MNSKIYLCLFVFVQSISLFSGERFAGKFAGTPIFDRWDACTLYSGVFLSYVSEKVKEQMRQYANQPVLLDVQKLTQEMNPGEARIEKFAYLGPAPKNEKLPDITLKTSAQVDKKGKIVVSLSIHNKSKKRFMWIATIWQSLFL